MKKSNSKGYQRGFFDHLFGKLGALMFVGGIITLFSDDAATGAAITVVGVLLFLLSFRCGNRHLQKYYRKQGVEEAIRHDTAPYDLSFKAYNARPGRGMLRYIRRLNPSAAAAIQAAPRKK